MHVASSIPQNTNGLLTMGGGLHSGKRGFSAIFRNKGWAYQLLHMETEYVALHLAIGVICEIHTGDCVEGNR